MPNKAKTESLVFTPHEVALSGYKAAERAYLNKDIGIPLNIPGTDIKDYFAPLLPWEICALQGQTHNGKSLFSDFWEWQVADHMTKNGIEGDIVHVSTEESIEAMAFFQYGRIMDVLPAQLARGELKDISQLQIAMRKIGESRIWRVAESSEHVNVLDGDEANQPDMTLSNIYRALKAMQDGKIADMTKIRLIVLDYLQSLPIDAEVKQTAPDAQRRLQVRNDVYRLRKMTVALQTPIVVAIQCKQKLDGNNAPYLIPGIYDGEETSAIAQRFDRIISLWMPKNDFPVGTPIYKSDSRLFDVTEDKCFLKVNKQRGGLPSSKVYELSIDFQKREYRSAYGLTQEERGVQR